MIRLSAALGSFVVIGTIIVGSLGVVVTTQTGCSGTCSDEESAKCTQTFTDCTNAAAAAASRPQCEQCAKAYCDCYDDCGNECKPEEHQGTCAQIPQ